MTHVHGYKKCEPCEWWQEAPLSGMLRNYMLRSHGERYSMVMKWKGVPPPANFIHPNLSLFIFILFYSTEFSISFPVSLPLFSRVTWVLLWGSINNSFPAGSERQMSPRVVPHSPPCVSMSASLTYSFFVVPSSAVFLKIFQNHMSNLCLNKDIYLRYRTAVLVPFLQLAVFFSKCTLRLCRFCV